MKANLKSYIQILQQSSLIDEVEEAMGNIEHEGQKIVPDILPIILDTKNAWKLRYRLLKVLLKLGVREASQVESLKNLAQHEKDEAICKLLEQIIAQAIVVKTTKKSKYCTENPDPSWTKIPAFDASEMEELEPFLENEKIPFAEMVFQLGESEEEDGNEMYVILVPPNMMDKTIAAIQDFLGFNETGAFSGECPACGHVCEDEKICPSCKIKLETDTLVELSQHPFIHFLYQEGFLDEKLETHKYRKSLEARFQSSMNPLDFLEPKQE